MHSEESSLPAIERATLHLYQMYDVSYAIDLERSRTLLTAPSARARPVVTRGGSIDIPQLPVEISLGSVTMGLAGTSLEARLHAHIYDLGILAFRLVMPLPEPLLWNRAAALLGAAQSYPPDIARVFERERDALLATLTLALERPNTAIQPEDYAILMIERLGPGTAASQLARDPVLVRTVLGERRPLSAAASTLTTPLSYYEDDLIVLSWNAALVVEPDAAARDDVTLLLELANAQLLAFRSYDAEVERDLAAVTPRIARSRRPRWVVLRSSSRILRQISTLIADINDTSARVENALKVTEDVYWNRVYAAALTVLRVEVWRAGIAETLAVLRDTASLLHDEAQEAWTTLLEVLVIALIAIELVVALLSLR